MSTSWSWWTTKRKKEIWLRAWRIRNALDQFSLMKCANVMTSVYLCHFILAQLPIEFLFWKKDLNWDSPYSITSMSLRTLSMCHFGTYWENKYIWLYLLYLGKIKPYGLDLQTTLELLLQHIQKESTTAFPMPYAMPPSPDATHDANKNIGNLSKHGSNYKFPFAQVCELTFIPIVALFLLACTETVLRNIQQYPNASAWWPLVFKRWCSKLRGLPYQPPRFGQPLVTSSLLFTVWLIYENSLKSVPKLCCLTKFYSSNSILSLFFFSKYPSWFLNYMPLLYFVVWAIFPIAKRMQFNSSNNFIISGYY